MTSNKTLNWSKQIYKLLSHNINIYTKDVLQTGIGYLSTSYTSQILDQTMLTFKIQLKQLNTLEDSIYAIKNMLVRGAPLIGVTAAYGMYLAVKKNPSLEHLNKHLEPYK